MTACARCARSGPRVALGVVRTVNGVSALLAPKMLLTRLGADAAGNPAAVYGLRMFGIRTVLIGMDLFSGDAAVREHAVAMAPLIHASDTASAAVAGAHGDLPRRAAMLATAVSGINVVLALLARRAQRCPGARGACKHGHRRTHSRCAAR